MAFHYIMKSENHEDQVISSTQFIDLFKKKIFCILATWNLVKNYWKREKRSFTKVLNFLCIKASCRNKKFKDLKVIWILIN